MHATPSLTHLFKILREERQEQVIEDLLYDYPYLISDELVSPKRQVRLDPNSRGDLLFYLTTKVVVVEIKRGVITVPAVRQISRYLTLLQKESHHKHLRGYLIGTSITPSANLLRAEAPWRITFRALDRDIPRNVVICQMCRRARDHALARCPRDRCSETL
jgi:RecB family endonuclease NucS